MILYLYIKVTNHSTEFPAVRGPALVAFSARAFSRPPQLIYYFVSPKVEIIWWSVVGVGDINRETNRHTSSSSSIGILAYIVH